MTRKEAWTWVLGIAVLTAAFGWGVLVLTALVVGLGRLRGKFSFSCARCGHTFESWQAYPTLPDSCEGCGRA